MPDPDNPARARRGDPLTAIEQEILALLSAGSSLPDIAARLRIALDIVQDHATRIYIKIGARSDAKALTPRELQILTLLSAGHSTADIASTLGVSPSTVKTHLTSVYKKIGAKNRVQAARYYLDHLGPPAGTSRGLPGAATPTRRVVGEAFDTRPQTVRHSSDDTRHGPR